MRNARVSLKACLSVGFGSVAWPISRSWPGGARQKPPEQGLVERTLRYPQPGLSSPPYLHCFSPKYLPGRLGEEGIEHERLGPALWSQRLSSQTLYPLANRTLLTVHNGATEVNTPLLTNFPTTSCCRANGQLQRHQYYVLSTLHLYWQGGAACFPGLWPRLKSADMCCKSCGPSVKELSNCRVSPVTASGVSPDF